MGGRKSSDGNSSGSVGATVMGLRIIQCGRQTVDVIQPDGQVRQFVLPLKVSDLLLLYPHHFVAHATTASATAAAAAAAAKRERGYSSATSSSSSIMLSSDSYLETGSIYVVLPFPRLFPLAPPPTPHLCSCFYPLLRAAEESTSGIGGAIRAEFKRHWPVGSAASSLSRISPEDCGSGIGLSSSSALLPRRLWEPALEIIAEDRVLVLNNPSSTKDHDCSPKENQMAKKLVSVVLNLNNKLRSSPATPSSSSPPTTTAA